MSTDQWIRRAGLIVSGGTDALDLSNFRFTFETSAQDHETPSNCFIRVYNLSKETVSKIRKEFDTVVLQAGYVGGAYGALFRGTIKQFRVGRENATDTYLDILAADGDFGYNFGMVSQSLAAEQTSHEERVRVAAAAMPGLSVGTYAGPTGGILPRGKVLFGMPRVIIRQVAQSVGASWHIQDGKVNVVPLKGYLPGEAVVLTSATGLIGRPEQTSNGIVVTCLLNPRIALATAVRIDNQSINQTLFQNPQIPVPYNQYSGVQYYADVSFDGLYRTYVVEHAGDTHGQEWYTKLVCLTIDASSGQVVAP